MLANSISCFFLFIFVYENLLLSTAFFQRNKLEVQYDKICNIIVDFNALPIIKLPPFSSGTSITWEIANFQFITDYTVTFVTHLEFQLNPIDMVYIFHKTCESKLRSFVLLNIN